MGVTQEALKSMRFPSEINQCPDGFTICVLEMYVYTCMDRIVFCINIDCALEMHAHCTWGVFQKIRATPDQ